ncbi:hypothetical protein CK486_17640, partial [Pseudomonas sp. HAR-UPW-AIA-41]|uniref:tandem-95 repeat protein n=1 Tax=Pseudomonas sp. HAR-UPW-AIA-41 TaxID=1985301 RepID=UPI000BD7E4F6
GQSAVLTIPYTVTDDQGAISTANLVITVTGTNDLSVISSASVDVIESNASLNTGGTLSISDIDGPAPSFNPATNASGSGGYGLFNLGSNGVWSYSTTGPLNQLVAGQSYTDTLTVTAADGSTGTVTVTILGTNDAPVLGGVRTSFTYSESAASVITRTLLDSSVTLTDIDSSNFDGGSVIVSISNGVATQDQLTVQDQGTGSGQISVVGSDVRYNFGSGAVSIGTISGGTGGTPLTISLNSNATPVAVDALVQRIAYGNSSQLPTTTPRTISITVNDGDGNANGGSSSVTQNITMNVTSVNDAPTFSNLGGARAFTEGGNAVVLDNNASLGDRELAVLGDFGGASLTLSRRGGTNSDDDFRGTGNLSLSAGEVRLSGVLVGSYDQAALTNGTLQITFNSGTSNAQANSVLRQIAYSNGSDAPPASVVIDYALNDNNSGAQGSGGAKTATGSVTVNISAVNDAPVAGSQSNSTAEDAPFNGQIIASDVDGGSLTYSLQTGASNGSVTLNSSTGAFVYTPNAGYSGADSFTVQVSDGRGGFVNSVINMSVTPVDDAPVLSLTTPATPVEGNAAEGNLISTASATDEDTPASGLNFSLTSNPGNVYAINAATGAVTLTAAGAALVNAGGDLPPVEVTVTDGNLTDSGSMNVPATQDINDEPTAIPLSLTTVEDNAIDGKVVASDPDGDTLTYSITTGNGPQHGTVTLNPNGTFSYLPTKDYNGTDAFTVTIDDGNGGVTISLVNITILPFNDAPETANQSKTTNEDQSVSGQVIASDVDGDRLSYIIQSGVANGSLLLNTATGEYTYTPNKDYNGTDSFTLRVYDPKGGYTESVVTITVAPVNDDPKSSPLFVTTVEDNTATGKINARDVDGDTLTYSIATGNGPQHGTVTLNPDGTFSYLPAKDYNGTDAFTVTIDDGNGGVTTSFVNITIQPFNDAPETANQSKTTNEDQSVSGQIIASDVDGDRLNYVIQSGVAHGSILLNTVTGEYTYTPNKDYNGTDTFTIRVYDPKGGYTDSVVTVTVAPVNDAPTSGPLFMNTVEDIAANGTIITRDVDGGTLTYSIATGNGPQHGTVTLNPDGTFSYLPAKDYNGTDAFTVTIDDGNGGVTTSLVNITIQPFNDAPETANQSKTTNEDQSVSGQIIASDVDGDSLSYAIQSGATHGSILLYTATGEYTYRPNKDYNGTDTFTIRVYDPKGGYTDSVVTVTVNPVDDAPILSLTTPTTPVEGSAAEGNLISTASATDKDTPATGLSFSLTNNPGNVYAINAATGAVTLTAAGAALVNAGGDLPPVEVTVTDGTTPISGSVNVPATSDINDAPIINVTAQTLIENSAAAGSVAATYTASDEEASSFIVSFTPGSNDDGYYVLANGRVELTQDGADHVNAGNSLPPVSLVVTETGSPALTGTDSDTPNVTLTNDAPVANADTASTNEETPVTIDVLSNDSDVDGPTLSIKSASVDPAQGTVSIVAGQLVFTPASNFTGAATITYVSTDGSDDSAPATVTVTVNPVNDAPVANTDTASTNEDTPVTIDVLSNDSDVDGPALSIKSASVDPAQGTVSIVAGQLVFTPASNFTGTATITYVSTDGSDDSAPATVTVTVNPINDAPVAQASTASTGENTAFNGNVPAASDIDGTVNPNGYALVNGPAAGSLTFNANGSYSFNPDSAFDDLAAGESRNVTFTYTATDNN